MDPTWVFVALLLGAQIGLLVAVVLYRCPHPATLACMVLLPIGPLAVLPVTSGGIRLSWLLILSALALCAVRALVEQRGARLVEAVVGHPLQVLILSFLGVTVLSSMASGSARVTEHLWSDVYRLGVGIGVFYLMVLHLDDRERFNRGVGWLAATGWPVGLVGLVEVVSRRRFYEMIHFDRWVSYREALETKTALSFGRTYGLAADAPFHTLDVITFVALCLYVLSIDHRARTRWFVGSLLAVLMFNLACSTARGPAAMAIVLLVVFAQIVRIPHRWTIAVGLLVGVVLLGLIVYVVAPEAVNFDRFFRTEGDSIDMRLFNAPIALSMFVDHPVLGVGPSRFAEVYMSYVLPEAPKGEVKNGSIVFHRPHNTYLELLAERGLAGFLVYLSLWGLCMLDLLRLARTSSDFQLRLFGAVGFAWFVGYLVFSMTSNGTLRYTVWLMMGLTAAARQLEVRLPPEERTAVPLRG